MAEPVSVYRIAGIGIRVEGSHITDGMLKLYHSDSQEWDQSLTLRRVEQLDPPVGSGMYRDPGLRVYGDGDMRIKYIGAVEQGPGAAQMRIARCGSRTDVQFRDRASDRMLLQAMELEHLLTRNRGFILHASYIAYRGRAILFTAPSETGKSTQAQLWCDHMGAELINGDRAAVRVFGDGVMACGIPFSGSSPVRKNVTLPLAAIVCLSQAPENTLTRLRGVRAFRRVWEGCTVDLWDREDVSESTRTVSDVIGSVPVWHLACTPDERAVMLLRKYLEVNT